MTVVGLTLKTRAVSRIPLPLRAMSTICCFTAGRRPWFRYLREKCAAGSRCGYSGRAVGHGAACHTAPHRHPDSLDNGPVHRSWRPPWWTMTDRPFYQHVNSFGTPPSSFHRACSSPSIVPATLLDTLAGGSTSQHNVPGQLHMPVVLGEFFVTLQYEMPLRPCFVLRPHCGRERRGLIALNMGDVGLDLLLYLLDSLTQVRHGAACAEFGIAVPWYLPARNDRAQPVARQSDTMGQNRTGCARVGHILRTLVQARIAQFFSDGEHAVKRGRHRGHKLLRGDRHTLPPPPKQSRQIRSVCQPTDSTDARDGPDHTRHPFMLRSAGWRESTALTAGPGRRRIRPGGARRPRTGPAVSAPAPSGTSAPHKSKATSCRLCQDRKSTRLNSSHLVISYAVF